MWVWSVTHNHPTMHRFSPRSLVASACARFRRLASTESVAKNQFDYIVVGAGTAGCLLANRLSADPSKKVLLIEAGGKDNYHWVHIPGSLLLCRFFCNICVGLTGASGVFVLHRKSAHGLALSNREGSGAQWTRAPVPKGQSAGRLLQH